MHRAFAKALVSLRKDECAQTPTVIGELQKQRELEGDLLASQVRLRALRQEHQRLCASARRLVALTRASESVRGDPEFADGSLGSSCLEGDMKRKLCHLQKRISSISASMRATDDDIRAKESRLHMAPRRCQCEESVGCRISEHRELLLVEEDLRHENDMFRMYIEGHPSLDLNRILHPEGDNPPTSPRAGALWRRRWDGPEDAAETSYGCSHHSPRCSEMQFLLMELVSRVSSSDVVFEDNSRFHGFFQRHPDVGDVFDILFDGCTGGLCTGHKRGRAGVGPEARAPKRLKTAGTQSNKEIPF